MCSVDAPGSAEATACGPVVRPSAEELLRPARRDLLCPEPGCGRRLPQPSALRFHLLRRHAGRPVTGSAALPASTVFVCPEEDCAALSAAKKTQFGSMKALKQHYMKVHAPRTLVCPECKKASFATEPLLRAHWRSCAVNFQCNCGAQYASIRSLRNHAAKHGHAPLFDVRPPTAKPAGLRRLAPKPSQDALHLLASIALAGVPARAGRPLTTCDAGTQTAARRTARGGRSSSTQTRLTSGPPEPTSRPAASQAGPPLVWGLLWPAAGVISCQTQTEERQQTAAQVPARQPSVSPVAEILWGARQTSSDPPQMLTSEEKQPPLPQTPSHQPTVQPVSRQPLASQPPPAGLPAAGPAAAGSQTEADTLSAQTQTQDPFDVIKHLLRADDEQLFPELSELSGTDIQTQTPWLTDDSQTQTPWLTDDPATSRAQTAPVTHMETQTCFMCLGPCDCWKD